MKKIFVVFGTRPEAIKMIPVFHELQKSKHFDTKIIVSGQHKEMLDQVLDRYHIVPYVNFDIMEQKQSLTDLTRRLMEKFDELYLKERPDLVLVHGDTTTALIAAFSAFFYKIKVGHVEAGLRTYDKYSPFPEEINRQLISRLVDYHFAPTEMAKENLKAEGIVKNVYVTGNTSIDTLVYNISKTHSSDAFLNTIEDDKLIVVTAHRRENLGESLENICIALKKIAKNHNEYSIVFPVHLNPLVKEVVYKHLDNIDNIYLIEPLDVLEFHHYLKKAKMILTDSGGIQEEAPSLGKPVLVLRDTTERPEGIEAGTLILVGTDPEGIYNKVTKLIIDSNYYDTFRNKKNPYGNGTASKQICSIIEQEYIM
ncbi:UDP-N-acetylglucosamine 2-epimerase [Enterococcus faecium EnGen0263]|uniref:non-hydrolyzing UDP-N-acetylglucosamine 2-epimerase n=1 Tax=Enterococcus TaxID=1350 RepID=UPI00032FA891|nr:UDP-N-acetylglucosamine 2-epimerase (non-hydrolyzing) [Enterococcus faecium]EOH55057.1 UDP-N-acetylglucosamine 2-epimerase [Enterococcus faecium EnGen0263]MCS8593713.1 UDP-N-acetylglucosamine 2-epimerase (non-hydrolyzing) [Enterococcus faecium]